MSSGLRRAALMAACLPCLPFRAEAGPKAPMGPAPLSAAEVTAGLDAVGETARNCFDPHPQEAEVAVHAIIERDGRVSAAWVKGELAGTETGGCIAAAVQSASFRSSSARRAVNHTYSFHWVFDEGTFAPAVEFGHRREPQPGMPVAPGQGPIDDRPNGPRPGKAPPGEPKPKGPGPLAKGAVVEGMKGTMPKVSECYATFQVPGMALVNVIIDKSGRVSSATVIGKLAGTPTGACVEAAVKTAHFPESAEGLSTPYPFMLK